MVYPPKRCNLCRCSQLEVDVDRFNVFSSSRVGDVVTNFIKVYDQEPRWENITSLAEALGFASAVQSPTDSYLGAQGVSDLFAHEIVEAATRVNYAQVCHYLPPADNSRLTYFQNVDELHALEGMVSMATNGATGVLGGNYQIFEEFARRSGAKLLLNTPVSSLPRFRFRSIVISRFPGYKHLFKIGLLDCTQRPRLGGVQSSYPRHAVPFKWHHVAGTAFFSDPSAALCPSPCDTFDNHLSYSQPRILRAYVHFQNSSNDPHNL